MLLAQLSLLRRRAQRRAAGSAPVLDEPPSLTSRWRAELLPFLESRFNPEIVDVLADEAVLARDSWSIVDRAANATAGTPGSDTTDGVRDGRWGQRPL